MGINRRLLKTGVCLCFLACLSVGLVSPAGCLPNQYQFGELTRLADAHKTDKGSALHHYTEVYEYFFYPIRLSARKICEIGILGGASLKMFADYFPGAVIYGIDIKDASSLNSDRIKTYIADQSNREQLRAFVKASGSDFDLILDDGGHTMKQQQVSMAFLFQHVKHGGYYIIEDLNTSLFLEYEVARDESNSTLTMINHYIRTGQIESIYMTGEEKRYLTREIDYCNFLSRDNGGSMTCIFKRK